MTKWMDHSVFDSLHFVTTQALQQFAHSNFTSSVSHQAFTASQDDILMIVHISVSMLDDKVYRFQQERRLMPCLN